MTLVVLRSPDRPPPGRSGVLISEGGWSGGTETYPKDEADKDQHALGNHHPEIHAALGRLLPKGREEGELEAPLGPDQE